MSEEALTVGCVRLSGEVKMKPQGSAREGGQRYSWGRLRAARDETREELE